MKSRGEMFMNKMKDSGIKWIGDSPIEWNKFTIGQLFEQVKQKNTGLIEKNLLSLSYGRIKRKDINSGDGLLPESFEGYNIIEKDDIVLRMTDLQNDKTSLRQGIAEERGIITSAYITMRAIHKVSPRFVYYQLYGFDVSKGYYGMGSGVRQGVNWKDIKKLSLILPNLELQNEIAKFLDEKTALIDEIITDTKQTIEELKSYKQSLISEIVTKGLDSSETLVPSGVEWIGDSPKEWNKFTIGQLFEQVRKKNTGMIETNLLSLSYGRIKKRDINSGDGLLPESFEGYNIIEKDDIVLRMTDLQNDKKSLRQGISEERGIITSAYITIRATKKVSSRFVYYQLFGFDVNKGYYGMGSGVRQSVNWNDVKKLTLMLPSFELQNQIADFLDRKTAQIDTLITEKENVISKYENYKKSMIYEYVTGKKRVEGYES